MTADFSANPIFNPEAGFSGVKFGANTPLLEVELNLLQAILLNNMKKFAENVIGNGILHLGTINIKNGVLTVDNEVAVVNGFVTTITSTSIPVSVKDTVYINFNEVEIDYTDKIKKYGNLNGDDTVPNNLLDPRIGEETSRRYQYVYKLTKDSEAPGINIPLCTVTGDTTYNRIYDNSSNYFRNELNKIQDQITDVYSELVDHVNKSDLASAVNEIKSYVTKTFVSSDTEPTADHIGDMWFDPSTKLFKIWDGTTWQDLTVASPSGTMNFQTNDARLVIPVGTSKYAT